MGGHMNKKFVTKKKRFKILKYFIYLFIVYFSYQFVINFSLDMKLVNNNEEFLRNLINNSNYYNIYEKKSNNIITKLGNMINNFDLSKPLSVFERSFSFNTSLNDNLILTPNITNSDGTINIEELRKVNQHINDPNPSNIQNPRVYIYNSHQNETYSNKNFEIYNITPNVMMASYLLKEKLNKLGIGAIAEDADLISFLNANGWDHNASYRASRFFVIDALNKHPNLDLIIDLHRDALTKEQSTVVINDKNYAKILFVMGTENEYTKKNNDLARSLNDSIKEKYPGLSRGILKRDGLTEKGAYNQDLNSNMILLEVGAQHNTIEEVLNTIDALAMVIAEYLEKLDENRG